MFLYAERYENNGSAKLDALDRLDYKRIYSMAVTVYFHYRVVDL